MSACVEVKGFQQVAIHARADALVEGRSEVLRHLKQHLVLIVEPVDAGRERRRPFHGDSNPTRPRTKSQLCFTAVLIMAFWMS